MSKEDTQFGREGNPARQGLAANTKPIADKSISVRFYAEDIDALNAMNDRSGFIRDAVHQALNGSCAARG
jgi:hypothetical protein